MACLLVGKRRWAGRGGQGGMVFEGGTGTNRDIRTGIGQKGEEREGLI